MLRVTLSNMAWINKEDLTREKIENLKNVLTVVQKSTSIHSVPATIFTYREDPLRDRFGVPLFFYMKTRPKDDNLSIQLSNGDTVISDMEFKGKLRDNQIEPYEKFMSKTKEDLFFGGIISLPCGIGKTVIALKIVSDLKRKALVIVHKEFLVNQWKERIEQFLPNVKVGRIQQDICDIEGKDIVIGMVHSIASREYGGIYNRFGVVIFDEAHHASATTFSEAVPRFNSRYRIGLSATAERKDRTERVFFNTLGDIVYHKEMDKVDVGVRKVRTPFMYRCLGGYNPTKVSDERIVTIMSRNTDRNRIIALEISQACEKSRKCLVLSDRLDHLELLTDKLRDILKEKGIVRSIDFFVGGRKEVELKEAAKASVIMATYAMASEAFDVPELDTVYLATPKSDIRQSVGRILRTCDDKRRPIVVDFIDERDEFSMRRYRMREEFYKESGWVQERR